MGDIQIGKRKGGKRCNNNLILKIFNVSLTISEMQIKTTLRLHLTLPRMAKTIRINDKKMLACLWGKSKT